VRPCEQPGQQRHVLGHGVVEQLLGNELKLPGVPAVAGVRIANLDTYRFRPIPALPGVVLGYGNLADHQVRDAVTRLASVARTAR
jgi:hypothetical protein